MSAARDRSSDSGLPPPPPSRPVGQWLPAKEQLPLQRRDRPGFAPGSLTACRWKRPYHGPMPASRALSVWLPVVLWAALIFTLSSIPSLSTGLGGWDTVLRKGAHLTEYAILGALLLRALGRAVPAVAAGALYAASDELHQHFVSGRHASPLDVLLDTAGVAVGVYVLRRLGQARLVPGTRHGS
jgi:VanZ family protein